MIAAIPPPRFAVDGADFIHARGGVDSPGKRATFSRRSFFLILSKKNGRNAAYVRSSTSYSLCARADYHVERVINVSVCSVSMMRMMRIGRHVRRDWS